MFPFQFYLCVLRDSSGNTTARACFPSVNMKAVQTIKTISYTAITETIVNLANKDLADWVAATAPLLWEGKKHQVSDP